jgi:hypothetical protein
MANVKANKEVRTEVGHRSIPGRIPRMRRIISSKFDTMIKPGRGQVFYG